MDAGSRNSGRPRTSRCLRRLNTHAMFSRRAVVIVLLGLVGLVSLGVKYKYWFWPKRFRIVEPGQIYRGGWQTPVMLRRILRDYHIKTLLNVACKPSEPEAAGEGSIVREAGVDWHKILMPGTGMATLAQLDEAADIIADAAHRPIFIHCAAGVHRTNMSLAAYRLKYCRWSLCAVLDEMTCNGFAGAVDNDKELLLAEYMEYLRSSHPSKLLTCSIMKKPSEERR